ncbi:lipocalin-like domain-containing protein [Streptosporangium sp. NPDC006930]|uniref:lipocalin-like domain-containing protein n=1 Tax=unclassified Streptosporangium TaxID=2632669 RepID=UPI0034126ED4
MIVGTWRLVDYVMEGEPDDGARSLGDEPLGLLIYGPDGYMSVQYMAGDRPLLRTENWRWTTDEEKLAAVRTFGAYAGRYEWSGDRVIHQVETAVYPNWIGATLVRLAVVDGDRLTLRAERTPGRPPTPILTWERIR